MFLVSHPFFKMKYGVPNWGKNSLVKVSLTKAGLTGMITFCNLETMLLLMQTECLLSSYVTLLDHIQLQITTSTIFHMHSWYTRWLPSYTCTFDLVFFLLWTLHLYLLYFLLLFLNYIFYFYFYLLGSTLPDFESSANSISILLSQI